MFGSKKSGQKKGGGKGHEPNRPPKKKHNLGMFGMYEDDNMDIGGDDDDKDQDLEAELNELLGAGKKQAPAPKPKPKEAMDLNAVLNWTSQIAASIEDDDDDDEDLDENEEGEFMSELVDLVGDDQSSLQAPAANTQRSPSPSPHPGGATGGGNQMQLLQERKKNYETAIQNAKTAGESSKARRYQRGMTTLDDLLKKAKAGKPINDEDIPPQVATGKPVQNNPQQPALPNVAAPVSPPASNVTTPNDSTAGTQPATQRPSPPSQVPEAAKFTMGDPLDTPASSKVVETLQRRQHEFKVCAFTAKKSGNKEDALKFLRISKQLDSVLEEAKLGKAVDLSQIPSSPAQSGQSSSAAPVSQASKPTAVVSPQPRVGAVEKPQEENPQPQQAEAKTIPVPKTLLEGLIQRREKYQATADQSSGSKARRMGRIVKQYDDIIRAHKAGRPVNVGELPVPIGYPPLPGEKAAGPVDVMAVAGNILKNDDEAPQLQVSQAAVATAAAKQPGRPLPSPNTLNTPKSPSRTPSPKRPDARHPGSAYQQQIEFLVNRQAEFKQAALVAKNSGDKQTAMDMLRKMKGFEPMIEQAKNGLRIDISKVPQPPLSSKSKSKKDDDSQFELLGGGNSHEDDGSIYKTLMDTLKEQIKKARGYSEQFTHSGDVNGANMFDKLSRESQQDYDFVMNLHRHSDPPPRYYFDTKTFDSVHIIPELNSSEMELIIVQLLDVDAKDSKPYVEFEMPFPHDNPIKDHTDQQSNLKYDAPFRVPISRKSKSFQRAIKTKAVKFHVVQKGGFLRSDKILGSAAVKLAPLETACEIRAVEPLKEGRASVGRIEVKIRMRTPLVGTDSKTITEKWLVVSHEHVKRRHVSSRPSQGHAPKPSGSRSSPKKETKIGSLEVLALEKRMVEAKIKDLQSKGEKPPTTVLQNQQLVQLKLNATQNFLREGGMNAKRAYLQFLKAEIGNLTKEAQTNVKYKKHDQAKFSLTKRKMIENEIQKMGPSNTYL